MKNKEHRQYRTNPFKRGWAKAAVGLATFLLPVAAIAPVAYAAGSSSISLSPASGSYTTGKSFTVGVYLNAGTDTPNAVEADFTVSGLTIANVVPTAVGNQNCLQDSKLGGYYKGSSIKIGCAILGSTYSGNSHIADITVTAGAVGSASITAVANTDVEATGTSVFNGIMPSAHFTVTAAPSGGTTIGGGSTGGGTTGGGGTSGGHTTSPPPGSTSGTSKGGSTPTSGGSTTQTSGGGATQTPAVTATAALTIVVTDSTGKPVKNAKVVVDDRYSEYTDAKGTAGFTGLPVGSHTVTVSASGKGTKQTTITLAANDSKQVPLKLAGSGVSTLLMAAGVAAVVIVVAGVGAISMRRSRRGLYANGVSMSGMVVGSADSPAMRLDGTTVVSPSNVSSMPTALSSQSPAGQTTPELPQTPLAPPPSPQPVVMPPAQQVPPTVIPPSSSTLPPAGGPRQSQP